MFIRIAESDSHVVKGSLQTRHTETTISSLDQKNYRQERSKMYRPDDSQFSWLFSYGQKSLVLSEVGIIADNAEIWTVRIVEDPIL